jgi:hypothetical protein
MLQRSSGVFTQPHTVSDIDRPMIGEAEAIADHVR